MSVVPANIESENLVLGSSAHRRLLGRFFLDTHLDYVPEQIEWPELGEEDLTRLRSLPFWQEAVSTENVTSNTVAAAAALEPDPLVRAAIELQGFEEMRHARLLLELTRRYRIPVEPPPRFTPRSLEDDFLFAGFGECFDSFFAFGLFALARESGLFPPALVKLFEPVMQEEARHILFFVNWVRYRRAQLPWWARAAFRLRCARIIVKQVASRVKTARSLGKAQPGSSGSGENFTLTAHQDLATEVTLHRLLGLCLRENESRLARYDARLERPRLVPRIARVLHQLLPSSV
ncbi:MAG TPA: ferritin-like domain-containing protein [Steroidobacteraceae bacterium]|nr:ferritin-like domain-containing protein [Steroidobacteraceae bacterium]